MKRYRISCVVMVALCTIVFAFTSCGGGGGSSSGSSGGTTPPQSANTLNGVAAAGAPIVGVVNVKGANGVTASANIDNTGSFSIDVSKLTAPYIMFAEGVVNGQTIRIYSVAVAAGDINITPITDLIVANASQGLPSTTYSSWTGSQINASTLTAAQTQVQNNLAPLLSSAGVSTTTNLMTTPFNANGTGLDEAIDYLNVAYNGTTATVTNTASGSSYTDDVTNPGASVGLPSSDTAATVAVMSDADGIKIFFQTYCTLWATSVPSLATATSQLGPLMAPDLVDDGVSDVATELYNWTSNGYGPPVGATFTVAISGPLDVTGTTYSKGYWVTGTVMSPSQPPSNFRVAMVFNGTNWLFYGDRRWVETDIESLARMYVPASGSPSFNTGFSFYLNDSYNYSSNHGVQSAIVIGPGLPSSGVILQLVPSSSTIFSLYNPTPPSSGSRYFISSDTIISQLSDNATYTFNFYTASAATVTIGMSPITSFSQIYAKAPIENANLSASLFPTITAPTTHNISAVQIPGTMPVSWTVPSNEWMNWVSLWWSDGVTTESIGNNPPYGATSTIIDTTTFSATSPVSANLHTESYDQYGSEYMIDWDFESI